MTKPRKVTPSAPKKPASLYNAVRDRLKAQDADTLHSRTQKAVEAFEAILGGKTVESESTISNRPAQAPWSLEGLVVDPDPKESVGKFGIFWDNGYHSFKMGVSDDPAKSARTYEDSTGSPWDHFAYTTNGMLEKLLKLLTGCEALK